MTVPLSLLYFFFPLHAGNKVVGPGREPDTLLLLRVPILSNIAVRQLLTVFLSVNTSMKISHDSRSVRLLRNKMFEITKKLPGQDAIQQYMTPLMLRKREVKRQIAEQIKQEERAIADEKFRVKRAQQQQAWKKARREKNRELTLKRQAAELSEKRKRAEEIEKLKKEALELRANKKREAAKKAMQLLRYNK